MNRLNSGYDGYSMSIRAAEAYAHDEKPLTKWRKDEILHLIEEYAADSEINFSLEKIKIKKKKLNILKDTFLICSSWHHTSIYCNRTDFYSFDYDRLSNITDNDIDLIVETEKSKREVNKSMEKKIGHGDISYLEWSGTRKHPKAKQIYLKNVNIEERGDFYFVTDDNNVLLLKKKIFSRGTSVVYYR